MKKLSADPVWKILLVALTISFGLSLFFLLVYGKGNMSNAELWWMLNANMAVGLVYFYSLWEFIKILIRRFPWEESPGKRFFFELVGVLAIIWVISTATFFAWGFAKGRSVAEIWDWATVEKYVNNSYVPIIVTLFMEARNFFYQWREALLRAERLKFSDLQTRHAYLQNQIKPHFLFNSLNVLASLVHKDADLAEKFVHELSKLYRRLLEMNSREIVALTEEMDALNSYLFLVKMRFGEALRVELADFQAFKTKALPPFTLQLLLENAVKHNEMAQDQPLKVRLDFSEDYAVVSNTLVPKTSPPENSTGIGLKNLQERYALLTKKEVIVAEAGGFFVVKVPLLEG